MKLEERTVKELLEEEVVLRYHQQTRMREDKYVGAAVQDTALFDC